MRIKIFVFIVVILGISMIFCENPQIIMFEQFKGGIVKELEKDVVIPFTLQRSHVIEITATLKDMPYTMIMDTGGMTLLEKSANDSLGFETMETPQQKVVFAIIDDLKLGDASVKGMKVGLVGFNETYKFTLPGMIGSDYLRFFNVEFDYKNQNVTLRNSHKMKSENKEQHLLDIEMVPPYFPTVNLQVNKEHSLPGMIDTGLHYAFVFPISWLENLSELEKENLIESEGYFARWPWTESPQNYFYLMPEIKLGDIVLKEVPVIFGEIPNFLSDSTALIGKYFFENYLTTIDYPSRQIKLTDVEESNYSLRFSAGINIAKKEGKLQITGVWENSPAFEAELKPADELIRVNGKSYDEISELEIADTIMDRTNIKFYVTVLRDGIEEEILLRKRDLFK